MKNPLCYGVFLLGFISIAAQGAEVKAPEGFTPLFNGTDTKGWRGGSTFDHRALLEMPEEERASKIEKWTADMLAHWSIADGEFVNDGKGAYATTEKDFGDF